MTKTLVVTKPFYMLEIGDTLDLSSDGTSYESSYNEEMGNSIDDGSDIYGSYSSTFKISKAYADELMQKGYLKADDTDTNKSTFVNVFSEIDNLLDKYKDELDNIDEDYANMPTCMKVEKTTVLDNMITVLNHLKNLKK
jgi:hypothetical protein